MPPVAPIGDASITGIILQYGLAGVCILALAYAYFRKDKRCDELSDKTSGALVAATAAINRLCDILKVKSEN